MITERGTFAKPRFFSELISAFSASMNTSRTDYLNIFLIVLSCLIAFNLPFELFLFSYAILGPLHYLSEIGWLHQRNYFISGKKDYLFLIFCSFVLTLVFLWMKNPEISWFKNYEQDTIFSAIKSFVFSTAGLIVFVAFASAVAFSVFKTWWKKLLLIVLAIAGGILIRDIKSFNLIFALFVPTVIHVWLFTGLFMFTGAYKSRQFSGYLSIIVFILCSLSFFLSSYKLQPYLVSEYIQSSFTESGFPGLNAGINEVFFGLEKAFSLNKGSGLKIQRFIAFAYTYHYLNWFSKTNIIKWHQVPKKWLISSVVIWILSVGLYIFDYKTGTLALFFLSVTHVFLEFPLNLKSMNLFVRKEEVVQKPIKRKKAFSSKTINA